MFLLFLSVPIAVCSLVHFLSCSQTPLVQFNPCSCSNYNISLSLKVINFLPRGPTALRAILWAPYGWVHATLPPSTHAFTPLPTVPIFAEGSRGRGHSRRFSCSEDSGSPLAEAVALIGGAIIAMGPKNHHHSSQSRRPCGPNCARNGCRMYPGRRRTSIAEGVPHTIV